MRISPLLFWVLEAFEIDTETANLVVKIYYKIRELQRLLAGDAFSYPKEILGSGKTLNVMMNSAFEESTKNGYSLKLNAIIAYLNFVIASSECSPKNHLHSQTVTLFNQLLADILSLQSKIHTKE